VTILCQIVITKPTVNRIQQTQRKYKHEVCEVVEKYGIELPRGFQMMIISEGTRAPNDTRANDLIKLYILTYYFVCTNSNINTTNPTYEYSDSIITIPQLEHEHNTYVESEIKLTREYALTSMIRQICSLSTTQTPVPI